MKECVDKFALSAYYVHHTKQLILYAYDQPKVGIKLLQ